MCRAESIREVLVQGGEAPALEKVLKEQPWSGAKGVCVCVSLFCLLFGVGFQRKARRKPGRLYIYIYI